MTKTPLIQNTWFCYLSLMMLAGLLYANTLSHGFVLDDEAVILKNQYVRQGTDGIIRIFGHDSFSGYETIGEGKSILAGGRYRPLSLVFFALIYDLFGDGAFPFHAFNVILYILSGLLIFMVLEVMLKNLKEARWIALLTTGIFLAHPVHTEVVANIKSADELLSMIFGLLFLLSFFHAVDKRKIMFAFLAALCWFLACLSKESAYTLALTGPLAIWFFRKESLKSLAMFSFPVLVAAVLYIFVRFSILDGQPGGTIMHDPMNNPFLSWDGQGWVQCAPMMKAATLLFIFAKYVWLMVIPYPLTHDYYPFHIALQSFSNPLVWVGFALLVTMTVYGMVSIRKKDAAGYGVLFFLISLLPVANIFFPVGTFMAERFLFIPSLGLILAFVLALFRLSPAKGKNKLWAGCVLLIISLSMMTIARNKVWKDNATLLLTDVKHAPNSAKLQNGAGTVLLNNALQQTDPARQKALLQEALAHLKKSIDLHPTYYDALLAYGACAYYLEMFDASVRAYRQASQQYPNDQNAITGLRYALDASGRDYLAKGNSSASIAALSEAWHILPDSLVAVQLGSLYQTLNQPDSSVIWFDRSHKAGR
jgi:hypothetical protein